MTVPSVPADHRGEFRQASHRVIPRLVETSVSFVLCSTGLVTAASDARKCLLRVESFLQKHRHRPRGGGVHEAGGLGGPRAEALVLPLSPCERQLLALLASAASDKEIADRRCLAEGTVKNHVTNILTKLDVRDRTQAAVGS